MFMKDDTPWVWSPVAELHLQRGVPQQSQDASQAKNAGIRLSQDSVLRTVAACHLVFRY